MAFSITQAWSGAASGSQASGVPIVLTLAAVPAAGSLLVARGLIGSLTGTLTTPTDTIGDGEPWLLATGPVDNTIIEREYLWWKQVGTPSGGGKDVSVTGDITGYTGVYVIEYAPGGTGTVTMNGSPVSTNGANGTISAGSITLTTGGLVVAVCSSSSNNSTAGTGFTSRQSTTFLNFLDAEDQYPSSSGAVTCEFVNATPAYWLALAAAFKLGPSRVGTLGQFDTELRIAGWW